MANIGIFDVLGPIMIGPSSSHTAGAARLGKIAGTIVNKPIKEVSFLLHGSFRETYKGHGTDRAFVAGILGFLPDDPNLKDSISIANEKGIIIRFLPADLGQVHPNTVKFLIKDIDDIKLTATGTPEDVVYIEKFREIRQVLCDELDVAFGSQISDVVFKHCSPFAIVNAEYFILTFLEAIRPEIEKRTKNASAIADKKLQKHVEKYLK